MIQVGDEELVEYFKRDSVISPLAQHLAEPLVAWQQAPLHEKETRLIPIYNLHSFLFKKELEPLIKGILIFEHLLTVTRAGFLGKFYRDHVSHMVRVLLIASMIYSKITKEMGIHLKRCDFNTLLLACLFHDIAYPAQEADVIFRGINAGLKSLYQSVDISSPSVVSCNSRHANSALKQLVGMNSRETLTNLPEDELYDLLHHHFFERLDHGVLSAVELAFLRDKYHGFAIIPADSYERALLAIALHNLPVQVDLDRFPELYILILADELQEWDRPVYKGYDAITVVMPKIGIEAREKNRGNMPSLTFHLDYSNRIEGFDPLRQLGSKARAISRLRADYLDINVFVDLCEPFSQRHILPLELCASKDEALWYIGGQESINWLDEKIQRVRSGGEENLYDDVNLLLGIWSENEGMLRKVLQVVNSALSMRCLDWANEYRLYRLILGDKLDDLKRSCSDGLREVLWQMRDAYREAYREARLKVARMTMPDEYCTLPEEGPASDEQIQEADRKVFGIGDGGVFKPHIQIFRSVNDSLRQVQDALDSIDR